MRRLHAALNPFEVAGKESLISDYSPGNEQGNLKSSIRLLLLLQALQAIVLLLAEHDYDVISRPPMESPGPEYSYILATLEDDETGDYPQYSMSLILTKQLTNCRRHHRLANIALVPSRSFPDRLLPAKKSRIQKLTGTSETIRQTLAQARWSRVQAFLEDDIDCVHCEICQGPRSAFILPQPAERITAPRKT